MSSAPPAQIRRVIPRWRDFRTALALGELANVRDDANRLFLNEALFAHKIAFWKRSASVVSASELVTAGLVLGRRNEVREAAEFLLSKGTTATGAVRDIAYYMLHPADPTQFAEPLAHSTAQLRRAVRGLRNRLVHYPRNPFTWVDLSRLYTVLGQDTPSIRAIQMALRLAPSNRFVLRSATRLYLHRGEPDIAHELLRRNDATPHDPWLLSAEIAVASIAERTPAFVRKARQTLDSGRYAPGDTTELASALATQEVFDGRTKKARRLFTRSLTDPTENSLAQAEWASKEIAGVVVEQELLSVPRSFEAGALKAFHDAEWHQGLEFSEQWLLDEPFSRRPAAIGSYIASVALEDFVLAERFARLGLEANRGDLLLMNNLVVALVGQGLVAKARDIFSEIDRPAAEEAVETTLIATEGLLTFRLGSIGKGRELYLEALKRRTARQDPRFRALAMIHLAREEFLAGTPRAEESIRAAEGESTTKWPEVVAMLRNLYRLTSLGRISADTHVTAHDSLFEHLTATHAEPVSSLDGLRSGLRERSWLVEDAAGAPFGIEAVFHRHLSEEALATYASQTITRPSIDVWEFLKLPMDTPTDKLAFVALYPSGAVRGLSAILHREATEMKLMLEVPLAVLDPESTIESIPPSGLRCRLTVLPLYQRIYGG